MAPKRKPLDTHTNATVPASKKPRREAKKHDTPSTLLCAARPDWHAIELPQLEIHSAALPPPQRTVDELFDYAHDLLRAENAAYQASHLSGSSSNKFLSTIMSSGTLEDKVSALTLLVQESPLHSMRAFEQLIALAKKKSRNQALMAVAALKDLLGQGSVLPSDRKLRAFGKQPGVQSALRGKTGRWTTGQPLPNGLQDLHLVVWAFEDWLKKAYFEVLQVLELWCNDEVEYSRSRASTYVWELLKDKPEQEENLLRLLVNKLGDNDRKIASRVSHLLLQLQITHPAMKAIIINSIEADCLFRPGQSQHAKYYAIITLNQTVLSQKEQQVANKLLDIYFSLFVQFLKPIEVKKMKREHEAKVAKQGGGGKAGRMAAKKRKAEERDDEAEVQLRDKLIAQVLAGVNRAFPFADTNDPTFEQQMNSIFRVAHSANLNTSIQALMLIQQISSQKHYGAERFYRTLYESLLDPRLSTSSKQVMYLNLLYKSLKNDFNVKRVQAFVKRLLQITSLHEPPFACGILYLIIELQGTFPQIQTMLSEAEVLEEDEEERFVDADDGLQEDDPIQVSTLRAESTRYDGKKRDPEHARAERSGLWEILLLAQHFHPSVALFADAVYEHNRMLAKPDPTQHTLMHFLDRFVYRNARTKQNVTHGSSIMQPMAGTNAASLLVIPGLSASTRHPLNSETFWAKKVEDVAADEVFFHSYFNAAGNKKRKSSSQHRPETTDEFDEEAGEDEIWQAIAQSKPEVAGEDSDDDLSLGDLDSAYDKSDDEQDDDSAAGIDLGGEDGEDDEQLEILLAGNDNNQDDAASSEAELDFLNLDSEGGEFDDEDEVPDILSEEDDPKEQDSAARNKKKRDERKKFRALPTFASVDDYAKLLDDGPEDY